MDSPKGHEQNADQIAYWNGPGGQRWARRQQVQDVLLAPIADILIDRARPQAGERIVDVGCGNGATTIAFARRNDAFPMPTDADHTPARQSACCSMNRDRAQVLEGGRPAGHRWPRPRRPAPSRGRRPRPAPTRRR